MKVHWWPHYSIWCSWDSGWLAVSCRTRKWTCQLLCSCELLQSLWSITVKRSLPEFETSAQALPGAPQTYQHGTQHEGTNRKNTVSNEVKLCRSEKFKVNNVNIGSLFSGWSQQLNALPVDLVCYLMSSLMMHCLLKNEKYPLPLQGLHKAFAIESLQFQEQREWFPLACLLQVRKYTQASFPILL